MSTARFSKLNTGGLSRRFTHVQSWIILLCLSAVIGSFASTSFGQIEQVRKRTLRLPKRPTPSPTPSPTPTEAVQTAPAATSPTPTPTPASLSVQGRVEASLALTTGNTDTKNLGSALDLTIKKDPWTYEFKTQYLTSSNQDVLTSERLYAELKGLRKLSDRSDLFADVYYLNNRFAGFNYQTTPDVGYGYEWILDEDVQLRTEAAVGVTYERKTDGVINNYNIGRGGLLFAWKLSETSEFFHETIIFSSLRDPEEWRLRSLTSVSTDITSLMALKVSYRYEYNNAPLIGKGRDDATTTTALVIRF